MVKALIELDDETNRVLNLIKAEHGLRDKSQAIAFLVKHGAAGAPQQKVTRFMDDGDKWMLAEDMPDMDFFFIQTPLPCFVDGFESPSGRAYRKILSVQTGYHLIFYFGTNDCNEVAEAIVQKIFCDSSFARTVNRQIVLHADKLREFCETIDEQKLSTLSNAALAEIFETQSRIHSDAYRYFWIPAAVDMFHNNLTSRLQKELKARGYTDEQVSEYFIILTSPVKKSLIQIEREEFLELAITIAKDKSQRSTFEELYKNFREQDSSKFGFKTHTKEYEEMLELKSSQLLSLIKPGIIKLIRKHYRKYFYVSHMWVGKASAFEHYLKELMVLFATHSDLKATLRDARREFEDTCSKRKRLLEKLRLDPKLVSIFDEFGDFMVTKIYRRYAQIYTMYKMEFVQQELANRFGITLMQARFMLPAERRDALLHRTIDKAELEERTKFCVYYTEKGAEIMYTGKRAQELSELAKRTETQEVMTFKGQIGCMGKTKGIVRIIIRPQDMFKMKQGDILVSIATDPDIVSAMKKAAAIVTEQGGVTSHAAIVSRELGIPCVIGTKIATKVLRDGDLVEVDANKGVVTILQKVK